MKSIKTIYKIGQGPSSSHTVGPYSASMYFREKYPDADGYRVILYGSLAFTGDGHGTAKAIRRVMNDAEIVFDTKTAVPHPNTMDFFAIKEGKETGHLRILSIGGGSIRVEGGESYDEKDIYPEKNMTEIIAYCRAHGIDLRQFIEEREDEDLRPYLMDVWKAMEQAVERGLGKEGVLPGGLNITRKAKLLFTNVSHNESSDVTMDRLISAFSYAVCEENASEDVVVTAPTCGSCGIIPSVMYYYKHYKGFTDEEIVDGLEVAGIIGNVIRTNASISGAECGCQAEVGSACSMAAGGLAYIYGLEIGQIEYAAEVAMEHNLGLTCDPVNGLVQIPCIERNAVAALRAISAVNLSRFLSATRKISFDDVVETMYKTGLDMNEKYRETSHGGLAAIYNERKA